MRKRPIVAGVVFGGAMAFAFSAMAGVLAVTASPFSAGSAPAVSACDTSNLRVGPADLTVSGGKFVAGGLEYRGADPACQAAGVDIVMAAILSDGSSVETVPRPVDGARSAASFVGGVVIDPRDVTGYATYVSQ